VPCIVLICLCRSFGKKVDGQIYPVVKKIYTLHSALRTLKNSFKLATKSKVTPQLDQETCCNSCQKMFLSFLTTGSIETLDCSFCLALRSKMLESYSCLSRWYIRNDFAKNKLGTARVMYDNLIKDYPEYGLS
jgi:hypothetical protein